MKATTPWITYRTRFLVTAKPLTTSLTFTDVLGRQHSGRKGDYLVESSDGVLRILPRQIFEDIYVPLLASETSGQNETPEQSNPLPLQQASRLDDSSQPRQPFPARETWQRPEPSLHLEPLRKPETLPQPKSLRKRETPTLPLPPHLTRKSPQPYRDRRTPTPGLRSL
jgi:hypothetical protein